MKTIIFILIISVLLVWGSANADSSFSGQLQCNGDTNLRVAPPKMFESPRAKPVNNIYMADLRWRFPGFTFTEKGRSIKVNRKSDGKEVYKTERSFRSEGIYLIRIGMLRDTRTYWPLDAYYYPTQIIPIVPKFLKALIDFTCLPIGFKILNPDDGLIEERWDGERWLRLNQLSQRNWGETGSLTGPVR